VTTTKRPAKKTASKAKAGAKVAARAAASTAAPKKKAPRIRLTKPGVEKPTPWSPPRETCPKCGGRALPQPSFSRDVARWRCADRACNALEWTTKRVAEP